MTDWKVVVSPAAKRDLRKLDEGPKREAFELLDDLEEDPLDVPSIELKTNPGIHRARFHRGMYRIIYRISARQRKVFVLRIRPRGIAYKGMKKPNA